MLDCFTAYDHFHLILMSFLPNFSDETSNQSSLSDAYQVKVDSSTNSSPSPEQSEPVSPTLLSDFKADDSQPPMLGQEIMEGMKSIGNYCSC